LTGKISIAMIIRKLFIILLILTYAAICFAQNDSLWILNTPKSKYTLSTNSQIKTSVVIRSKFNFQIDDTVKSNVTPIQPAYQSDFPVSPGLSLPDSYTRFNTNNVYYSDRSDYSFSKPGTNPNFNPTNPWNTNKMSDALIMGSLNTLFSLFNR
jgi:hypothetical protein